VNVTVIHNVYEKRVVVNERNVTRVSFNGGPGGIRAEVNRDERSAEHERHVSMTAEQNRHFEGARGDRSFLASVNHGRPEVAATPTIRPPIPGWSKSMRETSTRCSGSKTPSAKKRSGEMSRSNRN